MYASPTVSDWARSPSLNPSPSFSRNSHEPAPAAAVTVKCEPSDDYVPTTKCRAGSSKEKVTSHIVSSTPKLRPVVKWGMSPFSMSTGPSSSKKAMLPPPLVHRKKGKIAATMPCEGKRNTGAHVPDAQEVCKGQGRLGGSSGSIPIARGSACTVYARHRLPRAVRASWNAHDQDARHSTSIPGIRRRHYPTEAPVCPRLQPVESAPIGGAMRPSSMA
ncbi:hypothetical protein LXA43DRAFT_1101467 [Ganoderma leucocontextum]|nr:hypothetical protein LXA43DRAFT_1101467 [Ganoderma leucocontextum]